MNLREEIKSLLISNGIRETWLAKKLEIKPHTLHYLLYDAPDFDPDLYEKIRQIIQEYQYEFKFIEANDEEDYSLFDEDKLQKGIGERIRVFAKRKYGTLKKLSEEMGISPQQLQQYISGKREPGSRVLARLLKLGCDINWILGGAESFENYKIYKLESEIKNLHKTFSQIDSILKKHIHHDKNR